MSPINAKRTRPRVAGLVDDVTQSISTYNISVLVVAGGGGASGGSNGANTVPGAGAGGLVYRDVLTVAPGDAAITVTIGAGGTAGAAITGSKGGQGSNSVFGTITALGGGYATINLNENAGGSGAGGNYLSLIHI